MFTIYIISFILIFCLILEFKTLNKYKKLNEVNKSFLASITHDLKSPTSAQINMLNMLLKGDFGELNPKQYEMIKLTCSSSKYMSQLVGNIMTNCEHDAKVLKLNKTIFNLTNLINQICEENKYIAEEKGQKIIVTFDNNECYLNGDKLQIERVISNLLSNAINYGFKNTSIEISLKQNDNNINFSIANKSNPIPQKKLKQLFNKFTKFEHSNLNYNSTGLGLYISRQIIQMHGGKIFAHSDANGSCIFGFEIKSIQNTNSYELSKI